MNYIVDDIGTVVAALRSDVDGPPFYMYGHVLEINNRLKERNKDIVNKDRRYPLIALRLDIAEPLRDDVYQYSLNMAIITVTQPGYNAEERMANVFKPKLYPLFQLLMKQFQKSGLFMWPVGIDMPEHTKIDRPFWGEGYTQGSTGNAPGSTKQLFDDPVDAIEIVNLKLNQRLNRSCN